MRRSQGSETNIGQRSSFSWARVEIPPERFPHRQNNGPDSSASEAGYKQEGLYIISVAARILDMHPQTLRKYERIGLVRPSRTIGMLRLYSEIDVAKLRIIKHLVEELRINLAGVGLVMDMMRRISAFKQRIAPNQQVSWNVLQEELGIILDTIHKR